MSLFDKIRLGGKDESAKPLLTGLELKCIRTDSGANMRDHNDPTIEPTIERFREALANGDEFKRVVLFQDDANNYWMADGFLRFESHRRAGRLKIAAEVYKGTRRDAILYAVGANSDHGLPRTTDDKRRAVLTLLNDPEWGKWSDSDIAKRCRVSPTYVGDVRKTISPAPAPDPSLSTVESEKGGNPPAPKKERTYRHKSGKVTKMNVGNIGKKKKAKSKKTGAPNSPETNAPITTSPPTAEEKTPLQQAQNHLAQMVACLPKLTKAELPGFVVEVRTAIAVERIDALLAEMEEGTRPDDEPPDILKLPDAAKNKASLPQEEAA